MNTLDLLIVLAGVVAVIGGYRLGFVARVASWVGLALGVVAGILLLPSIVGSLDHTDERGSLLLVAAGVMVGFAFAGQALGLFVGTRLHVAIPQGNLRKVDAGVGAVAGLLGVLVAVWVLAPAMADVPDWPARQARSSAIVKAVDGAFPDPPDTSRTLRRLLGDRYPQVFDALRRAPQVGPPPAASGISDETFRRVSASTVKVSGQACSQVQEGTGFVVADDLVATNAHVVAGESSTSVQRTDGRSLDGTVVAFDPDRDLALVRVPGLDRPVLPLGDASDGTTGGVFGHPGGGPLRVAPFSVGDRVTATGTDIYDARKTERDVLILASDLHPGDSGSALVTPAGRVVGVAFAIAPDRPQVAYALAVPELRAVLAGPHQVPVPTGSCLG